MEDWKGKLSQLNRWGIGAYDEFNDIYSREGGAKRGDAKIEASSQELFGLFLALLWEVWIHTSAAVNRYGPTAHSLSLHTVARFGCSVTEPTPSLSLSLSPTMLAQGEGGGIFSVNL